MSKINPIDDLFKKGLDKKGLDYSDTAWTEMESLLSKNRTSAFYFNWKFYSSVLGLLAILYLLWPNKSTHTPLNNQTTLLQHQNQEIQEAITTENNTVVPSITTPSNPTTLNNIEGENTHRPLYINNETFQAHEIVDVEAVDSSQDLILSAEEGIYTFDLANQLTPKPIPSFSCSSKYPLFAEKTITNYPSAFLSVFIEPNMSYGIYTKLYSGPLAALKNGQESERAFMSQSVDFRFEKQHLSIISGFGIAQFSEKTNYTQQKEHLSFDTSYVLVQRNYEQRPNGSYAALIKKQIDTSRTYTETVPCVNCKTTFKYISLPVAVRYDIAVKRFSLFGQAGLTFNFVQKAEGIYSLGLTEGGTSNDQTGNLSVSHLNNALIMANAKTGASYRLTPKWNTSLAFSYNQFLNSSMKNYNQKGKTYAVQFGLGWQLN